jgi:TsgA-like MFS transporter
MNRSKISLTAIGLLAFFSQSGFGSQIGVLIGPIADKYGISTASAATLFTVLIGGSLLGNFIGYFAFDYFRIKIVIITSYGLIVFSVLGLYLIDQFYFLPIAFILIGICSGIGVCAGGTLVSQLWTGKTRQAFIVSQDAAFNFAGALFPFITASILYIGLDWSVSYLIVGLTSLIIISLSMKSSFNYSSAKSEGHHDQTEWNVNIIISGLCLLILMLAQYFIIIWSPQYVEQTFSVSQKESAGIISNFYTAALFTSIIATYIVSKIRIVYFLAGMVLLGFYCSWQFLQATKFEDFYQYSFIFGVAIAATYNSFLVYGINFVKSPSHKNISFMLLNGGIGAALAPYLSGKVVAIYEMHAALELGCIFFIIVFFLLITNEIISRRMQRKTLASM